MRMSNCDHAIVDAFLREIHDPSADDTAMQNHLNSCDECRSYFAERAAKKEFWDEAATLLQASEFDTAGRAEFSVGSQTTTPVNSQQIPDLLSRLAPTDDPNSVGRIGDLEITGVIGAGAMGIVLKASDRSLDRVVAVKVLASHLANSDSARKRFAREAKAVAAVLHSNVIPIHGVSEFEKLPYFVMSYVRGESLQKRINEVGPLRVEEISRIGHQVAAGLSAAHKKGLVHRDIKPANILLEGKTERVTITDFGLARAVDDVSLTKAGVIAGTPQYMSPEQSNGESVDQRSDLFSLGSVLYALCTGCPPFQAQTSYGLVREVNDSEPISIQKLNPTIPVWLSALIEKLLAKKKTERFQTADEVHQLIETCLRHVEQPSTVALPPELLAGPTTRLSNLSSRKFILGFVAMISLMCIVFPFLSSFMGQQDRTQQNSRDAVSNRTIVVNQEPTEPSVELAKTIQRMERTEGCCRLIVDGALNILHNNSAYRYVMVYEDRVKVSDPAMDDRRQQTAELDGLKGSDVTEIVISPNGRFIATSTRSEVVLWDAETGESLRTIHDDRAAQRLLFSPSGRYLLTVTGSQAQMLELPRSGVSGGWWAKSMNHDDLITHAQFSRNEARLLTGSKDGSVILWEASPSHPVLQEFKPAGILSSVSFSPDEKSVLTVSTGKELHPARVWDTSSGNLLLVINHASPASASFTEDGGQIVSVSKDVITWWNVEDGTDQTSLSLAGIAHGDARFSRDRLVLTYGIGEAIVWDTADPRPISRLYFGGELLADRFSAAGVERVELNTVSSYKGRTEALHGATVFDPWSLDRPTDSQLAPEPAPDPRPNGEDPGPQRDADETMRVQSSVPTVSAKQQPEFKVEVRIIESAAIDGLTSQDPSSLSHLRIKPALVITPSEVASVRERTLQGPTIADAKTGKSKHYRRLAIDIQLTDEAKLKLKAAVEKTSSRKLTTVLNDKHLGDWTKYVTDDSQDHSTLVHWSQFSPRIHIRDDRKKMERLVEFLTSSRKNAN